ncbi:MAG: Rpn family recombination-promoting nuclease/putative transposase, partial [Spirochaetales bacterium]|nr:Rpn family recombination-promoting nuclease/putative transposase [Spirochaetales bacterium]
MALTYRPSRDALLNPCADPTFKTIFTDDSDESRGALTCFLSDILEKQVTDVVLQPNELSGEALDDKQSEFDINCKIDGKAVNIEMQGRNENSCYGKRAEYHVAHLLNHYTPRGKEWQDVPQVFQISVLNFIFDAEEEKGINWYTMKNESGCQIENLLNIIFIELPKIKQLPDDVSKLTKTQMWGKFFLYASNKDKQAYIKELCAHNRGINMAVTVLEHVSQDEMNWYHESRYWMHVSDMKTAERHAIETGMAKGMEQGIQQGIQQGI